MSVWAGKVVKMSSSQWRFTQPSPTALFCPRCESIFNTPNFELELICPDCGFSCPMEDFKQDTNVKSTETQERDDYARMNARSAGAGKKQFKRAIVKETCPECGHDEQYFHTLQLRSVDEGQTVFLECVKCGHSTSTNT